MRLRSKIISGVVAVALIGGSVSLINWNSERYAESREKKLEDFVRSEQPISATVLHESYENRLEPVPEIHIDGLVSQAHSNPTVTLESAYTLKIRTDDGRVMGLSVIDGGNFRKEALDQLIDEGSRISFPTGNLCKVDYRGHPIFVGLDIEVYARETYIEPNAQTATKRADRIRVQ